MCILRLMGEVLLVGPSRTDRARGRGARGANGLRRSATVGGPDESSRR